MQWPKHGANPQYLYEHLNEDMPQKTIDFSVNLNPHGPPDSIQRAWESWRQAIVDYPDPQGRALKEALAQKEQLPFESILLGNGAAELIQLLAIFLAEQKIALFQPTFSEYERMCRAYQAQLSYASTELLQDKKALENLTQRHDAIFLCHPNNPTGEIYPKERLQLLIDYCEQAQCYLILDEAFYDFVEDAVSMKDVLGKTRYLIILRSVTKMFAIAGVRLGMCYAHPQVVEKLRLFQPYWSVNAIALEMGKQLLKEEAFVKNTQAFIRHQSAYYYPKLKALGFELSDSQVNYFLLRDPALENQEPLLRFLLSQGIIPRHTENYPFLEGRYLRFALRSDADMTILMEVLMQWQAN